MGQAGNKGNKEQRTALKTAYKRRAIPSGRSPKNPGRSKGKKKKKNN